MPPLAQQMAFVESQAASIEPRVRMIRHARIQYPELVGISREANPHADSIVYYSYDGTGSMVDIGNRSNDFPLIDLNEEQHTVGIHWKGLAYDWSDREIGRAQLLGTPLSDRKVRLAFRIAEEEKERIFLEGDADKRWDGMINHPEIPHDTAPHTWANATDKQLFDMIDDLLAGSWIQTKEVRIADTLLLPLAQYKELNRPMGDNANRSIREYVMENNIYTATTGQPLMIRTLRQLDDAGPGNVSRAMAYPRDREVLRLHVPQELTFIEPQRWGTTWVYHGTLVLAGLEIMEPISMRYLNNV